MAILFIRRSSSFLGVAILFVCLLPEGIAYADARYSHEIQQRMDRAVRDPAVAAVPLTVIVEADPATTVSSLIGSYGGKLRYRWNRFHEISSPAGKLASLIRALPETALVRLPYPHEPAAVTGQGVALTGAGDMQVLGQAGGGVTIGVIDLQFSNYTNSQASGDLPSSLVITDYTGTGTGGGTHGTNVAEIVHEMAPGAALRLAKIGTETQLSQAVNDMIAAGTDVIVHSVAWFNAAFYDGTGPLCDITGTAEAAGIQWINAAGNYRSGHYLGTFTDGNSDLRHEFAANQNYNTVSLTGGAKVSLYLNWDAYPTTYEDYDLYLYSGNPDSGGVVVASSTNKQSKGGLRYPYPYEAIREYVPPLSGTYYIVVSKKTSSVANLRFTLFSPGPALGVRTTASSIVQPADCYNVLGTGATNLSDVPEGFSSEGPTTDGRAKPEVSGPDGVKTSLISAFYGTSASAPHVGAAVALLRAQNPELSLPQLRWLLTSTAKDVHTAGYDYRTGSGRISLDADGDGYNHDSDNCPLVSNPDQADMDGDAIGDACDPDIDGDELSNEEELAPGTDPYNPDTDGDGLTDGEEVNVYITNPLNPDTDGDGLTDGEEVNVYDTDPNVPDNPNAGGTGDLAPRGAPDGVVDMADYLIMQRIVLGEIQPTAQELARGDVYPPGAPDGVIDLSDLILLLGRIR
jgi:hypothetical protein